MAKAYTFTEVGARRIVDAVRKVEGGQPRQFTDPRAARPVDTVVWAKIVSSSSAGTNKWTYTVKIQVGGSTTSHSGLRDYSADTFTAYNAAEELALTGYVNSSVTALLAIPNNSLVMCTWVNRNGSNVLLFRERNEPTC